MVHSGFCSLPFFSPSLSPKKIMRPLVAGGDMQGLCWEQQQLRRRQWRLQSRYRTRRPQICRIRRIRIRSRRAAVAAAAARQIIQIRMHHRATDGVGCIVYQGTQKLRATILRRGGRWRRQQRTRDRRRRMFRPLLLLRSRDEERTTRRLSDPRSRICGFYDVSLNNNHLNYV